MPRFVVLRHDPPPDAAGTLHWDFMLEIGDVLKTWALDEEPQDGASIRATALADHRLAYLDYEGPVSQNRGFVTRWDQGTFELLGVTDQVWRVRLSGEKLRDEVLCQRDATDAQRWRIDFGNREPVSSVR